MPTVTRSVVLPFWLDRPAEEAVEIAAAAERAGFASLWIGEMATFDAFALATAIGLRAPRLRLTIGPLAIGVRTPVAMALGVSSVATLTGSAVDVALGASSPAIVHGWHDRPWEALPTQMRETVTVLRALLAGERGDFDGARVRTHGFRLQRPMPQATITVAAFGPAMTRVAARVADQVVLNLVTPAHVAAVRAIIDGEAHAARSPVAAARGVGSRRARPRRRDARAAGVADRRLSPAARLRRDVRGTRVRGARRASARRSSRHELALAVPRDLLAAVGALGSAAEIEARLAAYHAAGADHVALVPSTAEDPAGRAVLSTLSPGAGSRATS